MSSVIPVGIDLGTTLSAASYVDADGHTQMIRNSSGSILTPSVVLFDDDNIVVGNAAWEAAVEFPGRVAENAKRDVGASLYRYKIVGQQYPPEVIQGCILRQLRHDIVAKIGENFRAVITVPAYFDEARRKITADSGTMSGLPVLDIVNEPTAAALAFGERLGYLSPDGAPEGDLKLVVYDLGGGTFDVTVMQLSAGQVRTLSTDGDYELGGIHWDARLADHATEQFRQMHPGVGEFNDRDTARMLRAARGAKHDLSVLPMASLVFEKDGCQMSLPVSRDDFEMLTADLVERTVFTTNQAVKAAGLLWNDIDRLLLVGGSTRMLAVREAMKRVSGKEPDDSVHPDEAVARGAAVFARYLMGVRGIDAEVPRLRVTDVNSHGLGIEGINQETMRVENVTLIPRNTPLPYSVTRRFVTKTDNQRSIKIQLLEGESSLPDQCSPLAVAALRNLPPGLPAGTPITVTYNYDTSGRLSVNAAVEGLGDQAQIELDRVRGLPESRIDRWKKVICRDGGYQDFEDAVASMLLSDDMLHGAKSQPAKPVPQPTPKTEPKRHTLEPAIDHGAPQAASQSLRNQKQAVAASRGGPTATSPAPRTQPTTSAAPKAASPTSAPKTVSATKMQALVDEKGETKRDEDEFTMGVVLGSFVAVFLGLFVLYYGACLLFPSINVLGLPLP
ncbi:Hsp70 family protein [Aeoliella sp. SH292]|uniref:Hsp70 family protein n=1 Tax=Aeoliella sp. SH292 TaxID=3454464 RepID=UPI003F94FDA9